MKIWKHVEQEEEKPKILGWKTKSSLALNEKMCLNFTSFNTVFFHELFFTIEQIHGIIIFHSRRCVYTIYYTEYIYNKNECFIAVFFISVIQKPFRHHQPSIRSSGILCMVLIDIIVVGNSVETWCDNEKDWLKINVWGVSESEQRKRLSRRVLLYESQNVFIEK